MEVIKTKKNMNPVALEIKAMILKSGYTQSEIVDMMSTDFGWSGSPPPTSPGN